MRRWLLPDASIRAKSWYFIQKAVTSKTLTERSERHGVQAVSEPKNCHGARFYLHVDARTLSGAKGGFNNHYKSVLGAGAKAKTVTNNLPILSVLVFRYFCFTVIIHKIV